MNATYEGTTEQAKEVLHHHAVLRRGLEERAGALGAAVEHGTASEEPLTALQEYLAGEILPHTEWEERTLYRAAVSQARGSQLVGTLTTEHRGGLYLRHRAMRRQVLEHLPDSACLKLVEPVAPLDHLG